MVSTTIAAEMSSAIRGLDTHRARIVHDVLPTTQVLSWIGSALRASSALLDREARDLGADDRVDYVIVDRHLTRC